MQEDKIKVRIKEKTGKYHRREGGKRVVYAPGDTLEVTSLEYEQIRDRVDKIGRPSIPAPLDIEEDRIKDEEIEEAKESDSKIIGGDNSQDANDDNIDEKPKELKEPEKSEEKTLELKFIGEGFWNVVNKLTGKNINDVPLSLDDAKALI